VGLTLELRYLARRGETANCGRVTFSWYREGRFGGKGRFGETERGVSQPPTKWEVYERILGIPYYVVFDRYTDQFRAFRLEGGSYRELIAEDKLWLSEVKLGLGLWYGTYQGIERL
jgi:hypothetical protein